MSKLSNPSGQTLTSVCWFCCRWTYVLIICTSLIVSTSLLAGGTIAQEASATAELSFTRDIRPIFQTHCFACHQGAKRSGEFLMTEFDSLLAGGESGSPAVTPGDPANSHLLEMVTPVDGDAAMPPDKPPLADTQIELIQRWISEGAKNDWVRKTPGYTAASPPQYRRLPTVTALDFSPDGTILAVSGIHEVLLLNPDTGALLGRLIGSSPRIESLKFSPDGARVAVAGGSPGDFGELQVWNVANRELLFSKFVGFDTIFGVSWSPDGRKIAFGCTDTSVRAIDSETGEFALFQDAQDDWVRDTVFSVDGSHLVSVGRDMACKLIEVATERFVDNITSITPGALKGGIASVARHPTRDEIVIGSADGIPKIYRMHRLTKRVIGDDANLIRRFPAMDGRVTTVDVSADGKRLLAASSLDGHGAIHIYSYEFDTTMPDDIKTISGKVVSNRSADENQRIESYVTGDIHRVAAIDLPGASVYAAAFHPSGAYFVAGGTDGIIRKFAVESGDHQGDLIPIAVSQNEIESEIADEWKFPPAKQNLDNALPSKNNGNSEATFANASSIEITAPSPPANIRSFSVEPNRVELLGRSAYVQLVAIAELDDGSMMDVTPYLSINHPNGLVAIDNTGLVQPLAEGSGQIELELNGQTVTVPFTVAYSAEAETRFVRDVSPVLAKLGCNAGTCHGSQDGKKGFKLSLRGYDPLFDVRSLTDDMSARRVNVAAPDESLMLLKCSAQVPHEGGQVIPRGSKYYTLIRDWIAGGAKLDPSDTKPQRIAIAPANPVLSAAGSRQQFRVIASYSDGTSRDVTREAIVDSSNTEVATAGATGIVTAIRRGESAVLARFEGAYAATTVTVMGNRDGFVWEDPPQFNAIDDFVAKKWQRMKILPSELCTDAEFIRRVYLDLTGLPPSADVVRRFLADSRETQTKRNAVIDELIGSDAFIDHWTNKWSDLLQVNRKFLGVEGAAKFHEWIQGHVAANTPYDEVVRQLLTAKGSNNDNPAASYYKILRDPAEIMENTTHLFLAIRFNCNKCHDHPFERWTQDQYYETAAFFAQVSLSADPASNNRTIGGTDVEAPKPLFEMVGDASEGEMRHDRTKKITSPNFPYQVATPDAAVGTRREQFASWLTSPDNPYFASSHVNRLWGYLLGVGLIEPLDDVRAGNPPTNPELLAYLTKEFVDSGFNSRHVLQMICKSRTYQLSIRSNQFNEDDAINYSHARPRRLPAEVMYDAMHFSMGSQLNIPGAPAGTRAAALADSGIAVPSGFFGTLGKPPRESACECERTSELQLASVLALVSGPDQAGVIGDVNNDIAELVASQPDDRALVDEIYLRVLGRFATDAEAKIFQDEYELVKADHDALIAARDRRAEEVGPRQQELELQRATAVEAATRDLNEYVARVDPTLAEREAAWQAKLAEAQRQVNEFNSKIDDEFLRWRNDQLTRVNWHPLVPAAVSQSSGGAMAVLADRSIRAIENRGNTITEVIAETEMTAISSLRLELLSDETLPSKGPGLAANGNCVLTELEIEVAPRSSPDSWQPVPVASAIADYEQPEFTIGKTFDGGKDDNRGWAVVPAVGKSHWATFQLKMPIGFTGGSRFRFRLTQSFADGLHQIGRFRLSIASLPETAGLSVSEELLATLSQPREKYSAEQLQQLMAVFQKGDVTKAKLEQALAEASVPLTLDPGIVERRVTLARVTQPVPPDPKLSQLQRDVEISTAQLANLRLTISQDLSWALINSPSFLFNR